MIAVYTGVFAVSAHVDVCSANNAKRGVMVSNQYFTNNPIENDR